MRKFTRMKRLETGGIQLVNPSDEPLLALPSAELVVWREYIEEDGDVLPSFASWQLVAPAALNALPLLGQSVRAKFLTFSGNCFLKDLNGGRSTWEGSGPIDGLDLDKLFTA